MTNEQETSFTPGEIEQLKQLEGVELFAFISALKKKHAADPQPSAPRVFIKTNRAPSEHEYVNGVCKWCGYTEEPNHDQ